MEGKLFKDYREDLMRELNRRETLYGKKVKKKGSDDEDEDDKKMDEKEDEE
jgi:hypothetical protein